MKKERNGINEINKVCKAILKLQENDFVEMRKVALEQYEYTHPLKQATAHWQHELGCHNIRVLDALENLQKVIIEGAKIQKP
jgi:hypothetical protein